MAILREAERGVGRQELFRKHGISEQTFYGWKRMYGGLGISEVRRIKQLEEESRNLASRPLHLTWETDVNRETEGN